MVRSISSKEEERQFFEAVGRVISEWRFLEDNLEAVFDALVDSSHRGLPSVIYYSVNSFPIRLKIIDALLKYRFGQTNKQAKQPLRLREWTNLRRRIGKLETVRNAIAHSLVHTFPSNRSGRRTHIRPSIFDNSLAVRFNPEAHPTLYLRDLVRIRRRIERTWNAIERFWSRIPAHRSGRKRR